MPADYLLQVPENVLPTKRWGSHGIPCVPVLANLYMEMFEEIAKNSWTSTTNLETLFGQHILCHAEDWSWRFPEHFNSIRPTIMFTMEQEDGNLPFLDSLLHRKDDKTLGVSVYRSQLTQTNTCISSPITLPTWRETWSPSSSTKLGPLPRTRMQPNTSGWSWRGMITQKHFWTQPTGPVQQHSQLKIL